MESNTDARPLTRRACLRLAGSAALVSLAALLELRDALAQAQVTGRPVLSHASLTEFLSANRPLLPQFSADPVRFVEAHFVLTPTARSFLAGLSQEDLSRAREAVGRAVNGNLPLRFQAIGPLQDPRQHLAVELPAPTIATRSIGAQASPVPAPPSAITVLVAACPP